MTGQAEALTVSEIKLDRVVKMKFVLAEDCVLESVINVSSFYSQPDCFVIVHKMGAAFEDRSFKGSYVAPAKAWIENRTRKKQEWVFVLLVDSNKEPAYEVRQQEIRLEGKGEEGARQDQAAAAGAARALLEAECFQGRTGGPSGRHPSPAASARIQSAVQTRSVPAAHTVLAAEGAVIAQ